MPRLTAFKAATELFERIYSQHSGSEPEAFKAANEAVEPMAPAVLEELGRWWIKE